MFNAKQFAKKLGRGAFLWVHHSILKESEAIEVITMIQMQYFLSLVPRLHSPTVLLRAKKQQQGSGGWE